MQVYYTVVGHPNGQSANNSVKEIVALKHFKIIFRHLAAGLTTASTPPRTLSGNIVLRSSSGASCLLIHLLSRGEGRGSAYGLTFSPELQSCRRQTGKRRPDRAAKPAVEHHVEFEQSWCPRRLRRCGGRSRLSYLELCVLLRGGEARNTPGRGR